MKLRILDSGKPLLRNVSNKSLSGEDEGEGESEGESVCEVEGYTSALGAIHI